MSYKCSWCEQTKDDYPAGSFTRVFDGYEPGLPNGRPIPKFVTLTNSRLCEACMSDPACTGEAMLKRIRAALTQEKQT